MDIETPLVRLHPSSRTALGSVVQLGFVIDQSRCIGCHACTVACKSENDVPVGDFRTWVKYVEEGSFPDVERAFTVLRCNQCTDAPCIEICPVTALDKRPDGIVDIDPDQCIGCKGCLQACPYDALFLNEEKGTAQKCHFCAHRTEIGLAPACTVVCPTEALIPGDFHDPESAVSKMRDEFDLTVRKPEAGTNPNVLYRDAAPAGVDPLLTNAAGGYLWSNQRPGPQLDAQLWEAMEGRAKDAPRTTYNVDRKPPWGAAISGYLWAKSLAGGAFLAGLPLIDPVASWLELPVSNTAAWAVPGLAFIALAATLIMLVADLKRPERFLKILLRPNMNSWLAKGSFILLGYQVLLVAWLALAYFERSAAGVVGGLLTVLTAVAGALSAGYTGWLFAQAKGRVLWMRRGLALHLMVQALLAGSAGLLVLDAIVGLGTEAASLLGSMLTASLAGHLLFTLFESRLAPVGREEEYTRASRLLTHGPYARRHWTIGVGLGIVLPMLLLFVPSLDVWPLAGLLALVGLAVEEDLLVRAGQALPIS